MTNANETMTAAEQDADLGDVLGEIEDLVEQEGSAAAEDAQEPPNAQEEQEQEQAQEQPEAVEDEAEAAEAQDPAIDPSSGKADCGAAVADVEGATEAPDHETAAEEGDGDDILREVLDAAKEQEAQDGDQGVEDSTQAVCADVREIPPAEPEAEVEETAPATKGPAVAVKPSVGVTAPKAPAVPAGRKGMLPPVRKIAAVPAAVPAAGAKAAAAGPSVPKVAAVGAKAVPGTAAKAATKPVAKPASGGAGTAKAGAGAGGAKSAPPAGKPTAAAKPGTAAPAKKAAVVVKPVVAAAGKSVTAAAPRAKAPAAPKVIQARLVPDDGDDEDVAKADAPGGEAARPAAKKAAKDPGDVNAKKGAAAGSSGAAGAAAAKKRVVTVGAKPSAAYELFMDEHKKRLMDEGMEAAEAGEQAVKDWAALAAEDKAEYEARAKEQHGEAEDDKQAARPRKVQQPKAPRAAAAEGGPKYYTNGYMLFLEEQRPAIVAANPEASFVDVGKLLGAEWRKLSKPEQEEYNTRAKGLNAQSGAQPKPRKSKKGGDATGGAEGSKQPAKTKKPAAPAPKPGKAAGKKAAGRGRDSADGEDDGLLGLAAAADDAAGMEVDGDDGAAAEPMSTGKKRPASSSRKRGGGSKGNKRRRRAVDDCEDEAAAAEGAAAEDSGDDSDREDVDWEAHPAEAILAKTSDGRYLVKRAGLGLDEYGIVNARAVKLQRLMLEGAAAPQGDGEEAPPPLPVSIDMVDEFEAFERSFWASVQDRSDGGDLDLDDLGEQSPLELCYYLGKLREPRMALHQSSIGRRDKDTMIRVPALRLSMAVQRVLAVERRRVDDLAARLAEVEGRLAQYEGEGGEAEAAEEVEV